MLKYVSLSTRNILAEISPHVLDVLRICKELAAGYFEGYQAEGTAYTLLLFRPRFFRLATWLRTGITAGATIDLLSTDATKPFIETKKWEGFVIGGFDEQIVPSITDAYLWTKAGEKYIAETLEFTYLDDVDRIPAQSLKRALIAPPQSRTRLQVYCERAGNTRIRPIGVIVTRAEPVMAERGFTYVVGELVE